MVTERIEPELSDDDTLYVNDPLFEDIRAAKEAADNAKIYFESLKDQAIEKYKTGPHKISGNGIELQRSVRQGSVDYKKIPEFKKLSQEDLEKYRGKPSETWTIRIGK